MTWIIIGVVVLVLFGLYLSATAGRLDRLHHRVDAAYNSLDIQLLRRSGAALELATSGVLDPVSSLVLADAAAITREDERSPHERAHAESDLTKAIAATLGTPEDVEVVCQNSTGASLVDALAANAHRTQLARVFYNDAVRACRAVRRQWLVRVFRLAGHTEWPHTVEMDDDIPEGLAGR